jgi:hypothetical protein
MKANIVALAIILLLTLVAAYVLGCATMPAMPSMPDTPSTGQLPNNPDAALNWLWPLLALIGAACLPLAVCLVAFMSWSIRSAILLGLGGIAIIIVAAVMKLYLETVVLILGTALIVAAILALWVGALMAWNMYKGFNQARRSDIKGDVVLDKAALKASYSKMTKNIISRLNGK